MQTVLQDVRSALCQLIKVPGFAITMICMLGLGVGSAAHDAALLISLGLTLSLIGVVSSLLPASRAASINPTQAFRTE